MSIIYQSNTARYYIQNYLWYPFLLTKEKYSKAGKLYMRKGLLDINYVLNEDQIIISYTPGEVFDTGIKKMLMDTGEYKEIGTYKCKIPLIDNKNKAIRLYSLFSSAKKFYQYYFTLQPRHCYEIIQGDRAQKTHFDLDINSENVFPNYTLADFANLILFNLLKSITNVLEKHNIILDWQEDFLLYQSHGDNKYSYHVILKYYCHSNHKEALSFYNLVIENMGEIFSKFVDRAVYSKMQAFRLLYSCKYGTTRYKRKIQQITFDKEYIFTDCEDKMEEWCHSLVSYTYYCKVLPNFNQQYKSCLQCQKLLEERLANEDNDLLKWTLQQIGVTCAECENKTLQINSQKTDIIEINYQEANKYVKQLEEIVKHPNCFQIRNINGNRIDLDKKSIYTCPICSRRHESENPFLIVENEFVYFYCRRAGKKILLFDSKNIQDKNLEIDNKQDIDKNINIETLIINNNNVLIPQSNMVKTHSNNYTLIRTSLGNSSIFD